LVVSPGQILPFPSAIETTIAIVTAQRRIRPIISIDVAFSEKILKTQGRIRRPVTSPAGTGAIRPEGPDLE